MKNLKLSLLGLVAAVAVSSLPHTASAQGYDHGWQARHRYHQAVRAERHDRMQAERAARWRWCHKHPGSCWR